MTPSDKPERSDSSSKQQEANQSSVMTESTEDSAETQTAETSHAAGSGDVQSDQATDAASSGSDGAAGAQAEAPPPWQRSAAMAGEDEARAAPSASAPSDGTPAGPAAPPPDTEDTQTIPKPVQDEPTVRTEVPKQSTGSDGRSTSGIGATGFGAASRSNATTAGRRPSRGPRRASLQIKRIDPWSVLKLALVLSVAMFFVWMIAVAVLYGVLEGMGVWDQLNGTFSDLTQPQNLASEPIISAGAVFGVASIVGAINIVLFTALATVSAFIYNVASDFAGGVEVTLSERE